ncbi:alpha/beta hydrolase [Citrobacter amalonaticus]|uniref:alpha/beta hydrolase n=1 Tax=Citrobacter amalonaticus TaxID=35703 RepID=UPI00300C3E04
MALENGIAQQVEEFIAAGRPSARRQRIDDRRAGYVASTVLAGETETRVEVRDVELEGMTLRVVSPRHASGALPCVIYYHGGCFVSGGFATHDNQLRQLAYASGCRVIAIQYRLAPEHTFPAAHDDAEKGAHLIWQYAEKLGIDRQRITLAGDSAGGHLALVTALRLKAAKQWLPAQLMLIYPMLDATASCESYNRNGLDYIITRDTLLTGYEWYLPHTDRQHPEASPLWRDDFNGLPPTHIITAEYDPLCDEGETLYQRLTMQGVDCTCQRYLGVIHGFFQLGGISHAARNAMQDLAWRAGMLREKTVADKAYAYSSSFPPSS